MAEKPKEDAQELVTGLVNTEEKGEKGDAHSPIEGVTGANHEAKGNGVEKSPGPPVNEVVDMKAAEREGEAPEKDVESKAAAAAEQGDEGAEGSGLYGHGALFLTVSSQMG